MAGSRTGCHTAPPLSGLGWLDLIGGRCPWKYQEAEDSSWPACPHHPPALRVQGGGGSTQPPPGWAFGCAVTWVLLQGAEGQPHRIKFRSTVTPWVLHLIILAQLLPQVQWNLTNLQSPKNMDTEQSLLCLPIFHHVDRGQGLLLAFSFSRK